MGSASAAALDSPGLGGGYGDPFNQSNQALPLVANASPFQRADLYNDFEDRKSFLSDAYDGKSRLTEHRDDSVSNFGTESYAPSRNMFQNNDPKAPLGKEILPGEILEGETVEDMKESSARRRWVTLCWFLTWWIPNFVLKFGGMKRLDVRQAWREKLAINMLIWFVCGCAIFIIAILGLLICPTQHVFDTNELASHSQENNPNQVYTSVRGEVFDLSSLVALHERVVDVVPAKSLLNYGGVAADDIFPVQVRGLLHSIN